MPQLGEGAHDLLTRGKALAAQGEYEAALRFFQVATQLAPAMWDAWQSLGATLSQVQRPAEALAATERALALDASRAVTWTQRGWQLSDLKRPAEALTCHQQAIALDPHAATAWAGKGQALYSLARRAGGEAAFARAAEALAAFERAIALDPHDATAWAGKGAALFTLKRTPRPSPHQSAPSRLTPARRRSGWA